MSENAAQQPHVSVVRDDEPAPPPTVEQERPIPESSPLADLRKRVSEAKAKRVKLSHVPGMPYVLAFRAISPGEYNVLLTNRTRKSRENDDFETLLNADLVVASSLGIFYEDDGTLRSVDGAYMDDKNEIHGQPLKFGDDRLAELLELEDGRNAVRQVREFFVAEGDIVAAGNTILRFSNLGDEELREFIRGN